MSVKIFTDAGSNLFKKILEDKGLDISILPMSVQLGDKVYKCYEDDIDVASLSTEFYEKMKSGVKTKTSLTNPGLLEEAINKEISKGNKVIYVSLASGISSNYSTSLMLANEINEQYNEDKVRVVDSKTASFGEAMIAIYAHDLAKQGLDLDDVYNRTVEYVDCVRSEFTVDSIKYLANTGRVSKITAALAKVLSIKPLLYGSNEGVIEMTGKAHGRNSAIKALCDQVIRFIKDKAKTVYIAHCNALEDAKRIASTLISEGIKNIEIYFYDLVTGSHVGPGTLAVFYEGYNRSIEKKSLVKEIINKIKKDN